MHPGIPHATASPSIAPNPFASTAPLVSLSTAGEETIAAIVTGQAVNAHLLHNLHDKPKHSETFVQAGPAQEGAVAIIRISGSNAMRMAMAVFQAGHKPHGGWKPRSHRVYHGHACSATGGIIDEVILHA